MTGNQPQDPRSLLKHIQSLHGHHSFEAQLSIQPENFLTRPCTMDVSLGQSLDPQSDPTECTQSIILPDYGSKVNFQNIVIFNTI